MARKSLTFLAVQMIEACTQWHKDDKATARQTTTQLLDYLRSEREILGDAALDPELALVEKLLANLK